MPLDGPLRAVPDPPFVGEEPGGDDHIHEHHDRAHSWRAVDLLAAGSTPLEPPVISGIVYPERRHVFSGEPESLKTWAAHVLCAEEIRAGKVAVVVDFETGARGTLERLRDLGLTDAELARFVLLTPSEPLSDPSVRADVEELLRERRPSIVVFDGYMGALEIHHFDPNSGVEIERFNRTIVSPFQAYGAAVVLIDHLTKSKETRGRFSIGSERKLGGADVHLGFEVVRPFGRGKSGLAKIVTHKDRPGYLPRPKAAELELTSDSETGRVTWEIRPADPVDDEHAFRPTNLMEKVSLYVATHGEDLPSRNQVEENVKGKRDFVRQAIDVLVAEGFIAEEPGPRNARLLRSQKPYREADDDAS